jgi:hypothetical protein
LLIQIEYYARVKLGFGKALSVLNRLIGDTPDFEQVVRPYKIDQPIHSQDLFSIILPKSEAQHFAESVFTIADIYGLEEVAKALREAKAEDIPKVKFVIERVSIGQSVKSLDWVWVLCIFGGLMVVFGINWCLGCCAFLP